jgi:4-amino-4-deoxy-L-arabinose transferase-like glycosyltransferase
MSLWEALVDRTTRMRELVRRAQPRAARERTRGRTARRGRPGTRVPRPLALLLVAVALFGVAWALLDPPFQSPDEDVHFSYVQTLAERQALPGSGPNALSDAENGLATATGAGPEELGAAPMQMSTTVDRHYLAQLTHESQSDGGGNNNASGYPPAYYLLDTLGYELAGPQASIIDHFYAASLFSIVFLLLTTIGVWLLAGELTGRRRELQLVAAACVGLWPMVTFISASVNPDALLYASWTWVLWMGVVILRRGLTARRGAAFAGLIALAMLTKASTLALLPAAIFVLAVGMWRLRRRAIQRALIAGGLTLAVFAIPVATWDVAAHLAAHHAGYGQTTVITGPIRSFNIREFLSYVWEYYLPRLPGQQPHYLDLPVISSYPAYEVWVASGWAAFGWVDVWFPHGIYPLFLAITILVGVASAAKLARVTLHNRRSPQLLAQGVPIAIFFALAFIVLLGGLHLSEYNMGGPFNQGRYLFPLAGLAGCAVALALTVLPRRLLPAGVGVVLGGLVVFQFACLGLEAGFYYA